MNIEEDYAIPNKSIIDSLSLVRSGAEFLPAWAIATLFSRSQGHKLTKETILKATREWVGNCRLGLVEHQSNPYDHDEVIPNMAQLPIEFAPKRRVSCADVLINLKSAIKAAEVIYPASDLEWIKKEIKNAANNSDLQTESIVAYRHVGKKSNKDKMNSRVDAIQDGGNTYAQRKVSLDKWRNESQIDITVLTTEKILDQLKQYDKSEWNIVIGSFKRDFWQQYSRENNIKLKPGRRPKK